MSFPTGAPAFPPASSARRRGALRIVDDVSALRSNRAALRYLGADAPALKDAEGFVDTGDVVALHGDRYLFVGRRGGIINVGGGQGSPEEVEAALNAHAAVRASRVFARKSPITGALVAAEIVLRDGAAADEATKHEFSPPAAPCCPPTRGRRFSVSSPSCRSPTAARWPAMDNVLVTGASRGIGLAIATRLAREGST